MGGRGEVRFCCHLWSCPLSVQSGQLINLVVGPVICRCEVCLSLLHNLNHTICLVSTDL